MRNVRGGRLPVPIVLAVVLAMASASDVRAQEDQDPGTSAADSVQLVFEREVFSYPAFERRNPFQPQTGDGDFGPRFEDLVLLGVIMNPEPTRSIAVIGARPPGATSGQGATRTFRVRRGQTVGNARVIDIQRRQVLMEVDEFGVRETRTLDLTRQPPPPPSPVQGIPDSAPGQPGLEPSDPPVGDPADPAVQQDADRGGARSPGDAGDAGDAWSWSLAATPVVGGHA